LKRAASVEVREQEVGELGDRKHEDQVKKELHGRDLVVALPLAAQQPLDVQPLDHVFLTSPRQVVGSTRSQSTSTQSSALEAGATPSFGYDR
jgi:hypothetical protein